MQNAWPRRRPRQHRWGRLRPRGHAWRSPRSHVRRPRPGPQSASRRPDPPRQGLHRHQPGPLRPGLDTPRSTGIGSMSGTNPAEAMRVIAGDLPDFPYLPELPDRGPGADLTGRTAALLVDMPVEVTPRGWRLAERPGRDLARARSMLASDLDVLAEVLEGYQGLVKIQLCGPWTLAAALELPRTMNVAVADPGAVADLTASLAEGAAGYVAEVLKRVPGAQLMVQLDEPSLPAVAEGEVPT